MGNAQSQSQPDKVALILSLPDGDVSESVPLDLQQLQLSNRALVGIDSDSLRRLLHVTLVNLSGNQLDGVPPAIFDMARVQSLNASTNCISSLPSELGRLTALKNLHLARNPIASLPDEIGELSALQWINVSNCELTTLPRSMARLQSLELLSVEQNKLEYLPVELNDMPTQTELFLFGNATLPSETPIPRMGFKCRKLLPDIVAASEKLSTIRAVATTLCLGLQDLDLPALVTLEIIDQLCGDTKIRMWAKWELITAVKHFHQRRVGKGKSGSLD
jgi:Leucine-rich repeat (LRR) protein